MMEEKLTKEKCVEALEMLCDNMQITSGIIEENINILEQLIEEHFTGR